MYLKYNWTILPSINDIVAPSSMPSHLEVPNISASFGCWLVTPITSWVFDCFQTGGTQSLSSVWAINSISITLCCCQNHDHLQSVLTQSVITFILIFYSLTCIYIRLIHMVDIFIQPWLIMLIIILLLGIIWWFYSFFLILFHIIWYRCSLVYLRSILKDTYLEQLLYWFCTSLICPWCPAWYSCQFNKAQQKKVLILQFILFAHLPEGWLMLNSPSDAGNVINLTWIPPL